MSTTIIRMLSNTIHQFTGSVRRGDVVEVPDDLAAHWTDQGLAEVAKGAKPTQGVPMVETTAGRWVEDKEEIARRAQNRPPDTTIGAITRADVGGGPPTNVPIDHAAAGATVAEPTSGPMTGRNQAEAPAAPTVAEVSNPGEPGSAPEERPVRDARPPEEAAPEK